MLEYDINIEDKHFRVKINSIGDEKAEVIVNNKTYSVFFAPRETRKSTPALPRKTEAIPTKGDDELTGNFDDKKDSIEIIKAPLPGTIMHISKKVGDTVKSGDVVLVMEAMKMENNVLASYDGTVKEINVKEGEAVQEGAILLRISH